MKRCVYILILLLMVSGCKVGPNYSRPPPIVPANFVEDKPCRTTLVSDEELVHWWVEAFNDPFLDDLLEETLICNFDLRLALERVYQARANYWIQFTQILPEIMSDFQGTKYRTSQSFTAISSNSSGLPPIQNFFQAGMDLVWEIDLFGRLRRNAQSAYYAWEATVEDERAVKISVLSQVANTYVAICYYQEKLDLTKRLIEYDEELAELAKVRFESGLSNESDVVNALSTLEADRATLNIQQIALKQNIYSLAVLLGRFPEEIVCEFNVNRPIPSISGKVPDSIPVDLLRRRPDIASAERQLASQTEQIGVAVAELFPTVSLIGSSSSYAANPLQGANIGVSSDHFGRLFTSCSRIWGIGTLLVWPVFDFGQRWANVNVQKLLTDQAYISYKKIVVTAFEEVETAFVAYYNEEERLALFTRQAQFDKKNFELVLDQYQAGLVNYTDALNARERWLISENSLTDSRQAIDSALIAIYKALGGDW